MLQGFGLLIAEKLAELVWDKIAERLDDREKTKGEIKAVSLEAAQLNEELRHATTDAERFQILGKIGSFSERVDRLRLRS